MSLVEILAVIGPIIGTVGGVATLYVNRLRERDKLEYDLKLKSLQDGLSRCEQDCSSAKETVSEANRRRETAELKAARLESDNAALERDNGELRSENKDLKEKLYGSGGARPHKHGNR